MLQLSSIFPGQFELLSSGSTDRFSNLLSPICFIYQQLACVIFHIGVNKGQQIGFLQFSTCSCLAFISECLEIRHNCSLPKIGNRYQVLNYSFNSSDLHKELHLETCNGGACLLQLSYPVIPNY